MTSDTFNQLLDAYRQRTVEMNVSSINQGPADDTPSWVKLLQRHVQEWKQHYTLESQSIEQVRKTYQHLRHQVGALSPAEQTAMLADELRKSKEVSTSFQAKRDLIWARHQQELSTSRFVA